MDGYTNSCRCSSWRIPQKTLYQNIYHGTLEELSELLLFSDSLGELLLLSLDTELLDGEEEL